MKVETPEINVVNNEAGNRFEARLGADIAVAEYMREESSIAFTHTFVPEELEGRGIGSLLARTALDFAREERLRVVPLCPFIAAYVRKHQEYMPLIDPAYSEVNRRVKTDEG